MCGLLSSVERVLLEMTRVDCSRARRAFRASIVAASTCNKGVGSEIVLLGSNWGILEAPYKTSVAVEINSDVNIACLGSVQMR